MARRSTRHTRLKTASGSSLLSPLQPLRGRSFFPMIHFLRLTWLTRPTAKINITMMCLTPRRPHTVVMVVIVEHFHPRLLTLSGHDVRDTAMITGSVTADWQGGNTRQNACIADAFFISVFGLNAYRRLFIYWGLDAWQPSNGSL